MHFRRLRPLIQATLVALAVGMPVPTVTAHDPLADAIKLYREASALYVQGRYAEAEPLAKRSLAIREKMLGPTIPMLP